MSTDVVQADYEELEQVAHVFGQQSTTIEQLIGQLRHGVETLQNGDWTGDAATAFFREMNGAIFPACQRLHSALQQSQATVNEISQILIAAEEEAAEPFKNGGAGPGQGATPSSADTIPEVVITPPGLFDNRRAAYRVGAPQEIKDFAFASGKATALKYEVEINGQKIPVYMPKNPDGKAGHIHSLEEITKGLAALPEASRKLVTQVNVEPQQNPDDSYWAKEYNDPNFRSYMTAGAAGVVSVYPSSSPTGQDYLDGTMIHETGHTLSQQQWGSDNNDARWDKWKAAMKSDQHVASKYAQNSPDEDFAETYQLYHQVKGTPQEQVERQRMPERFKMIDELLAK